MAGESDGVGAGCSRRRLTRIDNFVNSLLYGIVSERRAGIRHWERERLTQDPGTEKRNLGHPGLNYMPPISRSGVGTIS